MQWNASENMRIEDQNFMYLLQNSFLTQRVLEPNRAASVLDIVLCAQKEFVDNVKTKELLGSNDRSQLHFNIRILSDRTNGSILGKVTRYKIYKKLYFTSVCIQKH